MKSVYLLSGSYTKVDYPTDVMNELRKEVKKDYKFCFIPTFFDEIKKNKERCEKILKILKKQGIEICESFIIDDSIDDKKALEIIKKCDIFFLTGGDTLKQIEGINNKKIKDALRDNGKITIGLSAGSINLAKRVLLARDVNDNIPKTIIYDGVGLTEINVEPHCDFNDLNHWDDLLETSKINEIYCMCDNCSIVIRDNKTKIYGNYCIIKDGKIKYDNR